MAKKFAVDLYVDVLSPYSFIMFESLLSYRSQWPMTVALKPFATEHVYKETGNPPPFDGADAKKSYIKKDVTLLGKYYNIPITVREDIFKIAQEKSSINANRLICATQIEQPKKAEAVARALFRCLYVDQADIFESTDFREVLNSCDIPDVDSLLSAMLSDAAKEKVQRNTEEALQTGCFGAPWTVVTLENGRKETFFGCDRMHLIGHLMGHKFDGPLVSFSDLR